GHHLQHLAQTGSARDGSFGRTLNHRPVGHWVGERYPQLDDVGTGVNQRMHQLRSGVGGRIASGDIRNERGTARQLGKSGLEPLIGNVHGATTFRHNWMPAYSATVCMSLSPRPDRLTRMILSRDKLGAIFTACAMACEDSNAGMMPS